MADLSKIKLPSGTTYNIKDNNALPLTGGSITGPVSFGDSVSIDDATIGGLVVNGSASFTNNIQANTINGVTVGSNPKFTDTNTVTTATTTGSGNAVTAVTASNGALTITKGATFLTSHQDISGKADKSATVSTVAYDSTNKKITKTINGTTTDVVTVATLKTALGSMPASDVYSWAKASSKPTYTASEVGAAATSHAHGNITSGGDITATAPTIASGDQLIINDHSASKVTNGPTFDGSTTTTALTPKGTWENFSKFSGSYNDLTNKPTIPSVADLLDVFYPVGTIYETTVAPETFNPKTAWGGDWIQIKDKFLLSAGDIYSGGATGGHAEITLTAAQSGMRAHTHTTGTHYHTLSKHTHGSGSLSTNSDSHSHNTYYVEAKTNTTGSTRRFGPFGSSASGATAITTSSDSHSHSVNSGSTGEPSANYTSTAYNTTSGTGTPNTGGVNSISDHDATDPHDNMPPYVVVYIWKRIA